MCFLPKQKEVLCKQTQPCFGHGCQKRGACKSARQFCSWIIKNNRVGGMRTWNCCMHSCFVYGAIISRRVFFFYGESFLCLILNSPPSSWSPVLPHSLKRNESITKISANLKNRFYSMSLSTNSIYSVKISDLGLWITQITTESEYCMLLPRLLTTVPNHKNHFSFLHHCARRIPLVQSTASPVMLSAGFNWRFIPLPQDSSLSFTVPLSIYKMGIVSSLWGLHA